MMDLILIGQVLLDVTCFILASLPLLCLSLFAKPYHRGFYCDDQSIRYPYKSDTVTHTMLLVVCYFMSLFVFALVESIRVVVKKRRNTSLSSKSLTLQLLVSLFKVYGIFLFGSVVTLSITCIGKYTIGRLRPHFLSVCQPLPEVLLNCTRSDSTAYLRYISDDVCTKSKSDHYMIDSRMSFPSGHSSVAFYTAIFIAMYLHVRMTWKFAILLKPCLQAMLVFGAIFVCLSRVSDNKHHWSDVLVGAFLGCFIAALTCIYVLNQSIELKEEYQSYEALNEGHTARSSKANEMP